VHDRFVARATRELEPCAIEMTPRDRLVSAAASNAACASP
jgi:hypothetical protein